MAEKKDELKKDLLERVVYHLQRTSPITRSISLTKDKTEGQRKGAPNKGTIVYIFTS